MPIKLFVSVAAIAMATSIGSVSAAEQFTTLDGVTAVPMSASELDKVKGMHRHFFDANGGFHVIPNAPLTLDNDSDDGGLVIQGYNGLCVAGPISIPDVPSQC